MTEHIVSFSQVTKRYPGKLALNNVSFQLPRGRIIALVGPNGSGKSTILKLIAGLVRPSRGSVTVCGKKPAAGLPGKWPIFQSWMPFIPSLPWKKQ